MHVGKRYPFITRPDIVPNTLQTLGFVLPRKMVLKVTGAVGTLITPWNGVETLSTLWELSPDEKHVDYYFDGTAGHPGQWQFRFGVDDDVLGPTAAIQLQTSTIWFRVSGVEKARQSQKRNPAPAAWGFAYPTTIIQINQGDVWIRTVATSQFNFADVKAGAARWNQQPEYTPYKTRE